MKKEPTVHKWAKDGMWHTTECYYPSKADRRQFPVSYPADSIGPFFRWTKNAYNTKSEAVASL